jgi:CDP-paratose 2-epimerase
LLDPDHWAGTTFNAGGGRAGSLSLLEATALCRELTGREVPVTPEPDGRPGDVPVYLSDCTRLFAHTDWRPRHTPREVLAEASQWIEGHGDLLRAALP